MQLIHKDRDAERKIDWLMQDPERQYTMEAFISDHLYCLVFLSTSMLSSLDN